MKTKNAAKIRVIANVLSGISVIPWLIYFITLFRFPEQAPWALPFTPLKIFLLCILTAAWPIVVMSSLYFSRTRQSMTWSLLPLFLLTPIFLVAMGVALVMLVIAQLISQEPFMVPVAAIVGYLICALAYARFSKRLFPWKIAVAAAIGVIALSMAYVRFDISSEKGPHFLEKYPNVVQNNPIDPSEYQELLHSNPNTAHFPRSIPAYAKNIFCSSKPMFGPSQGHIELQMTLPPQKIEKIYSQANARAVGRFTGNEEHARLNADGTTDYFSNPATYYDLYDRGQPMTKSFETFVLGQHEGGHGEASEAFGIAISKKMSRVIYWSQWWS